MRQRVRYLWLLGINLFINSFTFGDGYVVVPMIRRYYVEKGGLFSGEELMEVAAIAQSSPSAVAIDLSGLAGYRAGGIPRAAVSCLAAVVSPLVILSAISLQYSAFSNSPVITAVLGGMEMGVAALIVGLVTDTYQIIMRERSWLLTAIIPISFLADFVYHMNVALILTACCGVCIMKIWWERSRKRRGESTC